MVDAGAPSDRKAARRQAGAHPKRKRVRD